MRDPATRRAWLARTLALAASARAGALAAQPAPIDASSTVRPRPLVFPADFGAHPDTRTEWWYLTGALWPETAAAGAAPPYGFQITFFRSRTDVPADHPSAFAARQLVFAHVALSDAASGRLHHDQRIAREGFGIAVAAPGDTRVKLRSWALERRDEAGASVYLARADTAAGFELDLALRGTQPLLLQGDAGYSRKGPRPAQASHYYSEPQLAVSGRLHVEGKTLAVRGRAWLDHEWSDALLDAEAVGWDWIGMNLADGGALTAFRLRRGDGSVLWAGGSHRAAGASAVRDFAPDEVHFEPGRLWPSPGTGARYPVEWTVTTPAGRHRVRARFDAQELDARGSTGTVYWEGLSDLVDGAGRLAGRGYLEMTGYAGRLRL